MYDKPMPSNLEAERAVLGSIMLDDSCFIFAQDILSADDFYLEAHRKTFRAMERLRIDERPIEPITVKAELTRADELEAAGGPAYLASLTDGMPRAANVSHYSKMVRDSAVSRSLIRGCSETMDMALAGNEPVSELLESQESQIVRLASRMASTGAERADKILELTYREIESVSAKKLAYVGLETGFADLDRITGGLPKGLVVLAARPGIGKTTLALNIASYVALCRGKQVLIISLEMSKVPLMKRILAAESEIDAHRIRTGYLSRDDWQKIGAAAGRIAPAGISIDDTPSRTVMSIRAQAIRHAKQFNLDLLIVDYLQLVGAPETSKRDFNRVQEVTAISRGLKALSSELGIPVIAISQLNRKIEERSGSKKPQLSDLRESGAIEQDADLVLFISPGENDLATVSVAKQRDGSTGEFDLIFRKEFNRFYNLSNVNAPGLF